jgi:hypothetical protein
LSGNRPRLGDQEENNGGAIPSGLNPQTCAVFVKRLWDRLKESGTHNDFMTALGQMIQEEHANGGETNGGQTNGGQTNGNGNGQRNDNLLHGYGPRDGGALNPRRNGANDRRLATDAAAVRASNSAGFQSRWGDIMGHVQVGDYSGYILTGAGGRRGR